MNELSLFLEPPLFMKKPPSQVVLLPGSALSLCCVANGSPRPRIEWSRAQQSSDLPPVFQENGCLEVTSAKDSNYGDYICRATNRFGLAETLTTVIVPLTGFVFSMFSLPFVDGHFILVSQKEFQKTIVPFKGWLILAETLVDCDFIVSKLFENLQNSAYTSKK